MEDFSSLAARSKDVRRRTAMRLEQPSQTLEKRTWHERQGSRNDYQDRRKRTELASAPLSYLAHGPTQKRRALSSTPGKPVPTPQGAVSSYLLCTRV
jgi:hypothetical protein